MKTTLKRNIKSLKRHKNYRIKDKTKKRKYKGGINTPNNFEANKPPVETNMNTVEPPVETNMNTVEPPVETNMNTVETPVETNMNTKGFGNS